MTKETNKKIIEIIVGTINIFFALLIIALAVISVFNKELVLGFIEWIGEIIKGLGKWNYLILFLSSFIESLPVIGVVVPGQNIMLLVAMFFAKEGYTELAIVCLVASLGAIIGNYCGYILGIKHGDNFFKKYGLWFGIGMTEVKYLKQGIQKWGPLGVTVGKFHNVSRAFVPFIAGSMGMNKPSFMLFNTIGSIIRATSMIILGTIFGKYYEWIVNHAGTIMLVILVSVIGYLYFFKREWVKQYIKEKNEELDEMVDGKVKEDKI